MVNFTSFVHTLASLLGQYFPEELDPSFKPIDSADCLQCRQLKFDFIIVGAGSAGCVLANRLSEIKNYKILLIEAGGDENYISDVPILYPKLSRTRFDWNFTTVQQQRACLDKNGFCEYPQGHAMGGSSTINVMRYVRGNRADFDEMAALGNYNWNYNYILPYFRKAENTTIPDLIYSCYHSINGPLSVNFTSFVHTLASLLGQYFPEELDPSLKPIDSAGCLQCRQLKFDFIIIGAGSAGCVLGNRLSQIEDWKILLIEDGDDENYISDVPAVQTKLFHTKYDWNYTTVMQKVCLNKNGFCEYHQGRALGGSSVINTMRYVRGNRADFDEWAALGNYGWNYTDVLPYFRKAENMTISSLRHSCYHSTNGPLCVSYSNYKNALLNEFLKAGNEFGLETVDYNGVQQIGINYIQTTIKDGTTRCSTSKAYLQPIRYRKNLYIFKNTLVKRIIFNENNRIAIGVECFRNGEHFNVFANKEVIITAGAINTPKLLLLSGIGPRKHLNELGIPVLADLPVGQTLYDHLYIQLNFSINQQILKKYDESSYDAILKYAKYRCGKLTSPNGLDIVAFINKQNMKNYPPDVELIMGPYISLDSGQNLTIPYLSIAVVQLKPKSIGTVKLKSRSFLDPPLIDPNYLADPEDMQIIKWGLREIFKYINTPTLAEYSMQWITKDVESYCGNLDYNNDTDLECYIKYSSRSLCHPVGTCKMGHISDWSSVVDAMLIVHSIANLRIAGTPIFPSPVRGHTNAAATMTAEKLSDIILTRYRGREV